MGEAEKGGWGKRRWLSGSLDLCHYSISPFCHFFIILSEFLYVPTYLIHNTYKFIIFIILISPRRGQRCELLVYSL